MVRKAIPSEHESRTFAQTKIDAGDWFDCINPSLGFIVHIKRALISQYANAAKIGEMDAAPAIARLVLQHRRRLDQWTIGQCEALLKQPLNAAWHILVKDGEYWISDEEFWPYF